ncbi:MAG: M15 family metallopeptidase [Acidimicrobiales bacterium]
MTNDTELPRSRRSASGRGGSRRRPALAFAVVLVAVTAGPAAATGVRDGSALPPYTATVSAVTRSTVPYSWRPGCPVAPSQLRLLHLRYFGFDGRSHVGEMIVNASVVDDVITVFGRLYAARFPIRRMVLVDVFHGRDPASMADDNTSGFNCRRAVAPGPPQWSVHAYGEAIDVNPVENPYIDVGVVMPPAGARFVDRADVRPGMAVAGGTLVEAFAAVGWYWGGHWTGSPDYQHFSSTGG